MKSDISGNENVITVSGNEENNGGDNENVQTEAAVITSYDYSVYMQNLENSLAINNALILACILLIGILCGLRKL